MRFGPETVRLDVKGRDRWADGELPHGTDGLSPEPSPQASLAALAWVSEWRSLGPVLQLGSLTTFRQTLSPGFRLLNPERCWENVHLKCLVRSGGGAGGEQWWLTGWREALTQGPVWPRTAWGGSPVGGVVTDTGSEGLSPPTAREGGLRQRT